jgi:site-specific recombinase XerD
LSTFTAAQVKLLIGWKARTFCQKRLHLMVLALLDTGARISEILNLHVNEIDLDNCLVTLDGKGQKQRKVPISFELRKAVFRYTTDLELEGQDYLLGTRKGGKLDRHVMSRDIKRLCERLGFDPPARTLHATRHTMASNFIKAGGSVTILQRLLGHSSITTTMMYVHLNTADLSAAVQRTSLLNGWKS